MGGFEKKYCYVLAYSYLPHFVFLVSYFDTRYSCSLAHPVSS